MKVTTAYGVILHSKHSSRRVRLVRVTGKGEPENRKQFHNVSDSGLLPMDCLGQGLRDRAFIAR
ncbi:hypothetical protein JB92DRAFT_2871269 [Gautieria morchelliformis]|nr:hypothetical protein JB92DRAFT_2871269 [Gautieria morchelliformis]